MILNTFTNTDRGIQLGLKIGAIEIKSKNIQSKNIETNNIDVSTINGIPYKSGTGNTISFDSNEDGDTNKIVVEEETTKFTTDNIQIHSKKKFNKINSDGSLIISGGGVDADYGIGIDNAQVSIFQNLNVFTKTDFHNQPLKGVKTINGLSVAGGIFSGTSTGNIINTTDISSLKPEGIGIMKVYKSKKGDSFHLQIMGNSSMVAGDTIQIIIIRNGNSIAESEILTIQNISKCFEIDAKITFRHIDEIGSIFTYCKFEYDDNIVRFNKTNTVNTTRTSTFDVLWKFVNRSDKSAVQTQMFNLKKIY